MIIKPQPGPQEDFLSSTVDIGIYGGSAFGGKTMALLLEPLYHVCNSKFKAVIFRRTYTQINVEGGVWDEASELYPNLGGLAKEGFKEFVFPSGATIRFTHLQYDKDRFNWQGSQVPFFGFDELTQFTKKQFEYLVYSRGRSNCGVVPYVRATCNPDPDSFVFELVRWYINKDTGYSIPERSGKIRWFIKIDEKYIWSDTKEKLLTEYHDLTPRSFKFVAAKITDNKIGMELNPSYLSGMQSLSLVDRKRLLDGNWNIRESAGNFFKRRYFDIIDIIPPTINKIRYWDRASTMPSASNLDPDWTVGILLSCDKNGNYFIENVERFRGTPGVVEETIKRIAGHDGVSVSIGIEQDPGSAGKSEGSYYLRQLVGFNVRLRQVSKKKIDRAKPVSAQSEAGNLKIVRGLWNQEFLNELENFPDGKHDDQVDALSGAFAMILEISKIYVG